MNHKPILFSSPMVRALLDGRKTMTRRIMKPQPVPSKIHEGEHWWDCKEVRSMVSVERELQNKDGVWEGLAESVNPYGKPGDLLWVRETWAPTFTYGGQGAGYYEWIESMHGELSADDPQLELCYKADGEDNNPTELYPCIGLNNKVLSKQEIPWRPSIFMPKWASRITLKITDIRVERLQDISEDDAKAEGASAELCTGYPFPGKKPASYRYGFEILWESINGAGSWDDNPFVWVIQFQCIKKNVLEVLNDRPN